MVEPLLKRSGAERDDIVFSLLVSVSLAGEYRADNFNVT